MVVFSDAGPQGTVPDNVGVTVAVCSETVGVAEGVWVEIVLGVMPEGQIVRGAVLLLVVVPRDSGGRSDHDQVSPSSIEVGAEVGAEVTAEAEVTDATVVGCETAPLFVNVAQIGRVG